MIRKIIFATFLLSIQTVSNAQSWSLSTNAGKWADLGTANIEVGVAVSRHLSLHAAAAYNPWTFRRGDGRQFQSRRQEYEASVRYWPWHIYSGWWINTAARYREYNTGGIFRSETEEGNALGAAVSAGYSLMLSHHFNIDFGLGLYGGRTAYTAYSCPKCGTITGRGNKWFLLPDDITIAFVWVF